MEPYKPVETVTVAHIGKSVVIKGELSGSENLFVDGQVDGTIDLRGQALTLGPNARIQANMQARDVVIQGKVNGDITADKVELRKTAEVTGKITTQRISLEDGAYFKGAIDVTREPAKQEPKPQAAAAAAAAAPIPPK